jgi:hypothetical protein
MPQGRFGADLDLTGFIQDYQEHLGTGHESTAGVHYVDGKGARPDSVEPIPRALYQRPQRPGEGPAPVLVGVGPSRCSTSRTVALRRPRFAWDPNRLYRDLGIAWPYVHATRRDLRVAYQDRDGQRSTRLTYCFQLLLSPAFRAMYDALPLGEMWMDDIYVQEAFKKRAAATAAERSRTGKPVTAEEVLDEWGYAVLPPDDSRTTPMGLDNDEPLDTEEPDGFDDEKHAGSVGTGWQYAFYLWRTTHQDFDRLADWQAAMVRELSERGISPTLTIGLLGNQPHRFVIAQVRDEPVVFLNHEAEVTPDLAALAATALLDQISARAPRALTQ